MSESFSELLRRVRGERSLATFAAYLSGAPIHPDKPPVSKTVLFQWEHGIRRPGRENFDRVVWGLRAEVDRATLANLWSVPLQRRAA